LFRRVAAALPGIDSKEDEQPTDLHQVIRPQADDQPESSCGC
jgi:hypothetical protein